MMNASDRAVLLSEYTEVDERLTICRFAVIVTAVFADVLAGAWELSLGVKRWHSTRSQLASPRCSEWHAMALQGVKQRIEQSNEIEADIAL